MSDYRVAIEVFEGPLDLLLTLVRRESLDITTVALAQVTDGYLRYLATLEEVDPGALAAFVEVASTLLLIKSRALLPQAAMPVDESDAEGEALAERLREYRQYRRTAEHLGQREKAGLRAYVRLVPPTEVTPALVPGEVSVGDLASAFEQALADAVAREEPGPEGVVRVARMRLADRLVDIRRLLDERGSVSFREVLLGARRDREYVIVSFLAVLELLRRGVVRARQDEIFGDILLELRPEAQGVAWSAADLVAGVRDE